jgi:hypothetical protein
MDDRILKELGDLARQRDGAERARLDERWDRLAAGTLTAEEEAELKALAGSSPEAREAYEAFRPLGADFQARVLSAINAERAGDAPQAELRETRPRLLPFRRAAVRRIEVWLGTAAAVAAGLFLFLRTSSPLPPLPGYQAELSGGSQEFRGGEPASASPLVVRPGSRLILTIRPDTAVKGGVEAHGFLSHMGQEDLRPWQPEPHSEFNDKGIVILNGTLGKDIQRGFWTIWGVVGRPGKAPTAKDLQAELRAGRTGNADWQAVSKNLQVKDPIDP